MSTATTNMSLTKPAVNSATDEDLWGAQLNTDLDTLDSWISKEFISFLVPSPVDGTKTFLLNTRHAGTITQVSTKSASGTCTATIKIDGVALGGTANSVSTSQQDQAHVSANTFPAGADFSYTIASNVSCQDMLVTIYNTRTSAGT